MNFDNNNLDFIEIPNTKKRKISDLEITSRKYKMEDDVNTVLDMRIVNKQFVHKGKNIINIHLIFKLDYHPKAFIDEYTIFSNFTVDVFDRNMVLINNPLSDLSICYLALHYKENGERLFQELNLKSKEIFFSSLQGKYIISEQEAHNLVRAILKNYFG